MFYSIDEYSFYECTSLIEIIIPSSAKILGYLFFIKCLPSLVRVINLSSTDEINGCLFIECTSLTDVSIPSSETIIIHGRAFK